MGLTVPQIVMMNHAAYINNKRLESRSKNRQTEEHSSSEIVMNGKKLEELTSEEQMRYYSDL